MTPLEPTEQLPFESFLSSFKEAIRNAFYEKDNIETFIQERGFPPLVLQTIMAEKPLSVFIPEKYGGRGTKVKESLGILDAASYESLPLSLTMGINLALFLSPFAKYAQESVKGDVYHRFLNQQNMGGLMITEPDFGSDALNMQTSNVKTGSSYNIKGTKHWQGLTGMADYWIIASRQKLADGNLGRDLDFFVSDAQQANQQIHVEEYYNNIGLYPIPYGKNIIDVQVQEQFKLEPETSGIKLMIDLLHRSRFQFPGMGMGFIRRMLDEAMNQCNTRIVRKNPLMAFDQVKHQVSRIQSAYTITSAMCARSASISGIENDLVPAAIEANSMKAYVTDLMQESAQTLTQVSGANGYKIENVGSRGIVDSRPFQVFEGPNEMLYTQIFDLSFKLMLRQKTRNFKEFITNYELTKNISGHFTSFLDFSVDSKLPQRKKIDLGKIISRIISANLVADMETKGFRQDLVNNAIDSIKHEVSMLVSSYKFNTNISPIEEYSEGSNWLDIC